MDLFVDIRQRRGVRGAQYAFVNSQRLQSRLAELGIGYLHRKDLAPTTAVRDYQKAADKTSQTAKRQRTALGRAFIEAYETNVLTPFKPESLIDDLPPEAQVMALFCVEREPVACHRSLVAERLEQVLGWEVMHITP